MQKVLDRVDFTLNCALYAAFKVKFDGVDRDTACYWYAAKSISRCDKWSFVIAQKMCQHPDRAAYILDQYYYWIFNETPHADSTEILPEVRGIAIVHKKGWVGEALMKRA